MKVHPAPLNSTGSTTSEVRIARMTLLARCEEGHATSPLSCARYAIVFIIIYYESVQNLRVQLPVVVALGRKIHACEVLAWAVLAWCEDVLAQLREPRARTSHGARSSHDD